MMIDWERFMSREDYFKETQSDPPSWPWQFLPSKHWEVGGWGTNDGKPEHLLWELGGRVWQLKKIRSTCNQFIPGIFMFIYPGFGKLTDQTPQLSQNI